MNDKPPLTWNKDLLGDPPGSKMLKCPECLREKNWYLQPFTPEEDAEVAMWRLQAAYRVRAGMKCMDFHANRARSEREKTGSEMPYWLRVQGSEMTLQRPAPDAASVEGLTAADLPDSFPFHWLHVVDRLLLSNRASALVPASGIGPRE